MDINDVVAERIEQARWKAAAAKRRREELAEARRRGLLLRHAQKLRNLHAQTGNVPPQQQEQPADTPPQAAPATEVTPARQDTEAAQTSTDRRSQ